MAFYNFLWNLYLQNFLFLNLNTVDGLDAVLPSKIFEYLATGLPVIMGLHGTSYEYVKKLGLDNVFLFQSNDCNDFILQYKRALKGKFKRVDRSSFRSKFCRKKIIHDTFSQILQKI